MKNLKNSFKLILIFTLLFSIGFIVFELFFSVDHLNVKNLSISHSKIDSKMSSLKIGVISDIKYGKNINKTKLEKMIDVINKQNLDVLLFLGDLTYTTDNNTKIEAEVTTLLKSIKAPLGKFYVLGDSDDKVVVPSILENANFENLENKTTKLYREGSFIQLVGINTDNDQNVFEKVSKDYFTLTMTHYPIIADSLSANSDYIIAGHTLGGQINIPYLSTNNEQSGKYVMGEYTINNTSTLYVNSGIGTTNNGIRFFVPPELTIIQLKPK